jgi:TetR/AcrR family transcriptional regulator, tetracycline repressor protein
VPEPKRRPGPPAKISREAVLAIARELPPRTMTLTAISDALGVTQPALYRYFPDRNAILDELAREARNTLVPPDPSLPWDQWLVEAARAERALWRRGADLYEAATLRAVWGPSTQLARVGLQVLTAAGFTTIEAVCALTITAEIAHVLGRAESQVDEPLPPEALREMQEMLADAEGSLSADELFEQSLAIAVDGLRARLPRKRSRLRAKPDGSG